MQAAIKHRACLDYNLASQLVRGRLFHGVRPEAVNPSLSTSDDTQLLRRVAHGDRQAFSQLYDRYAGVLYSTIVRVLNNTEEANDALQDVFLQIWDKADTYDASLGKPFTWALTLTRNKAIDRLRALKRRYSFIEEISHEMEETSRSFNSGSDDIFTQDQAALIRAAVATLPLEQRQAIEMAFLGGLTQSEIAAALNQPLGTIKARIRRGLLRLREALKGIV
jgi:RNA polymerase sigma-70 factor (ECF subfamily)